MNKTDIPVFVAPYFDNNGEYHGYIKEIPAKSTINDVINIYHLKNGILNFCFLEKNTSSYGGWTMVEEQSYTIEDLEKKNWTVIYDGKTQKN